MNPELPHLIVFGTRTFADERLLAERLDHFTAALGKIVVVTGGADGADRLADAWASDRKHTRMIFYPDWDKHGKSAGPIRNQEMIDHVLPKQARFAVGFWDGKSRGTADMIARVKSAGIPLRVVRF